MRQLDSQRGEAIDELNVKCEDDADQTPDHAMNPPSCSVWRACARRRTWNLEYHDGEEFPYLERDPGKPDLLEDILKPISR